MTNLYDFSADDIDGKKVPLEKYKGKTLLIVNTASQCGFTPQYAGLEKLHRDLADRGGGVDVDRVGGVVQARAAAGLLDGVAAEPAGGVRGGDEEP